MTKKKMRMIIAVSALVMVHLTLTACAGSGTDAAASTLTTTEAERPAEVSKAPKEETTSDSEAKLDILLTSAPIIGLGDALSSTMNRFELSSGNYSWSYLEKGELVSLVACGSHPLDLDPEKVEKLKLPRYNGMEEVSYSLSCVIPPDSATVREWDISQLGDVEAKENSLASYEDILFIKLKPGKVYEITAIWEESMLEVNGFYGEAAYVVVTE